MWLEVDVQSLHRHRPLVRHGSVETVGHSLCVCSCPPPWEVRAATKPPHLPSTVLPSGRAAPRPDHSQGTQWQGGGGRAVWLAGWLGASPRRQHLARG